MTSVSLTCIEDNGTTRGGGKVGWGHGEGLHGAREGQYLSGKGQHQEKKMGKRERGMGCTQWKQVE